MGKYWCELCNGSGVRVRWAWRWPFRFTSKCAFYLGETASEAKGRALAKEKGPSLRTIKPTGPTE